MLETCHRQGAWNVCMIAVKCKDFVLREYVVKHVCGLFERYVCVCRRTMTWLTTWMNCEKAAWKRTLALCKDWKETARLLVVSHLPSCTRPLSVLGSLHHECKHLVASEIALILNTLFKSRNLHAGSVRFLLQGIWELELISHFVLLMNDNFIFSFYGKFRISNSDFPLSKPLVFIVSNCLAFYSACHQGLKCFTNFLLFMLVCGMV